MWFIPLFACALMFRLWSLYVSIRHERVLKAEGGIEYASRNSNALAITHAVFYVASFAEASIRKPRLDQFALCGILLYVASCAMLLAVMHILGRFWSVKLIIASDHHFNDHALFRLVRHPNYYLAILPEMCGLALTLCAVTTITTVGPIYAFLLAKRIREEERVMRATFDAY